jgi:ubiquinone/menaquinone biosynthesis C-methylase UbiE
MSLLRTLRAILEERLALMAPARRLRLKLADRQLTAYAAGGPIRVLDAGCGDGLLSLALAKHHPDWTLVGVDLRDDMLDGARARARARGLDNVRFEAADLLRPLPVGGFNAVTALECLSEIADDEQALRMMAAALEPGGLLVAQVPNRDWQPVLPGSATTWREQVRQGYTSDQLSTVLERAGLRSVELSGTYRSLAAAAQEIRDRIKGRGLGIRLAAFPALAAAVQLEHLGATWGRPNAIAALARRPDQ